jgi:hypothetical protein
MQVEGRGLHAADLAVLKYTVALIPPGRGVGGADGGVRTGRIRHGFYGLEIVWHAGLPSVDHCAPGDR